eukprot:1362751-Rhodomonas_salina.1
MVRRGEGREKVEGEARGKEGVAAVVCLRRKGGCAPDGRARVRDVRSRCKGVQRNPCCTVRRLESEAFARRPHCGVCVKNVAAAPLWKVKCSTQVKFREETEERLKRSEEG